MSSALARGGVAPVHDRGRVLADTAVMIADGGRVPGALPEAVLEDLLGRRNASTGTTCARTDGRGGARWLIAAM